MTKNSVSWLPRSRLLAACPRSRITNRGRLNIELQRGMSCLPSCLLHTHLTVFQIGCCGLFIHPFFDHLFKAFVLIFWHLLEDRDITARVVRESLMFYSTLGCHTCLLIDQNSRLSYCSDLHHAFIISAQSNKGLVKHFNQNERSFWLQSQNLNMVRKRCAHLVVPICSLFWFGLTFWPFHKALSLQTTTALHATRVQSGRASRVASKCSEKKKHIPRGFHHPHGCLEFKIECLQSDTV